MIYRIAVIWLVCVATALAQPAPILRNALTTNSLVLWISSNGVVQGTSVSNINFVKSSSITWVLTNILGTFHISAVSSGGSGGSLGVGTNMVVMGYETNLLFSGHPGITILGTNVMGTNFIDIGPDWSFVASQTNLNAASNFLYGIAGETNWIGDAGITNATRIGLADGKANNTNLVKTLMGGAGIFLTNNVGGTNVMIAVDPVLANLIGTVSNNVTNVVSLSTSNATSKPLTNSYANGVLTLRGLSVSNNMVIIANESNYIVTWQGFTVVTNGANVIGLGNQIEFSSHPGITILATSVTSRAQIDIGPDWLITASQTNLTSASNVLQIASSNNVKVAAGAGSFVDTNSSGAAMVYTVSSITNAFIRLPVQGYLPWTNPPPPGLDQGTNMTWRQLYDDSTNETAFYQFTLPDRYFTNANLMISWSVLASAANKSNVWGVACMVVPAAGGVSVNVDSYNSTNTFTNIVMSVGYVTNTVISCGISNAVANDFIKLKVFRVGLDPFDNNTGDTAVHALLFEYDEKKP